MTKIAIFVEGQTELLFMDRLVRELAREHGLVVEFAEATGGAKRARHVKILKKVRPTARHDFYVLIVNCSGDSKVKSDILERYPGLVSSGYSAILGLRDVYGQFTYEEIPRLRSQMNAGLPQGRAQIRLFLSIMEIEAWFLAEHTHFTRLSPELTLEKIRHRLRFDPEKDDLQRRGHPSEDLNQIYHLAGHSYTKHKENVRRTIDLLNMPFFLSSVLWRFPDALELCKLLVGIFDAVDPDSLTINEITN